MELYLIQIKNAIVETTEQNMEAITKTDFNFEGQKSVYHGKVRDVYNINDDLMVMIVSDRISAFDVVLPEGITGTRRPEGCASGKSETLSSPGGLVEDLPIAFVC